MGDIADGMINGEFCDVCGIYLGGGCGFPQTCRACGGDADEYDFDSELIGAPPDDDGLTKQQRVDRASADYEDARAHALKNGLILKRFTDIHYQLGVDGGWLLNLYPSKTRIYPDPKRPKAPFLRFVGVRWTLMDVVEAAIEATSGVNQ